MADEPAAITASDPTTAVIGLLNGGRYRRWKELAGYGLAAYAIGAKVHGRLNGYRQERSFSVTVCDLDDIYTDVQRWLLDRIPEHERRGLMASTHRDKYSPFSTMAVDSPGNARKTTPRRSVFLTYDGAKPQVVDIGGHRIKVTTEKRTYGNSDQGNYGDPAKIAFIAADQAGREAAVAFLQDVATAYEASRHDNAADIWIGTRWGDWARVQEIPPRPLESVVLAGDLRERLISDLERFLADEAAYVQLGLPYHRGILLHGPAGTGKTSIAKVLAGHFGLDIYCLPLSSMKDDTDIGRMLAAVPPRSMLLLEDIDIVHAAKSRDDAAPGISMSGLLNALDGVATPHGLITVMTTNDIGVLDPALIRAGRADQQVLVDYVDDDQAARLLKTIYGERWLGFQPPSFADLQVAPAEIIEQVKPHLADPGAAVDALILMMMERIDARA